MAFFNSTPEMLGQKKTTIRGWLFFVS